MGNQNHSVARKRLSTLAITTTLAAVGVGVVGAGAANAATNSPTSHSQDSTATTSKTTYTLKVTTSNVPVVGETATADLSGFALDPSITDFSKVTITADWGDNSGPDTSSFTLDAKGKLVSETATHSYKDAKDYAVTVTVDDGIAKNAQTVEANFVADPVLKAALTPASNTTKKNTAVTLSLAGSSVDKAALAAGNVATTINWGDTTKAATIPGDPANIKAAGQALLSHSFTADGSYNVVVTLNDGLGDPNSTQTQTIKVTVSEGTVTGIVVDRASGDDRYLTGVTISKHEWADKGVTTDATRKQAKAVVLATGNDFADALAGVPLAKKAGGPLLLTDGTATTTKAEVLAEIQRILPTKGTTVYILGGDKAMNADIESQIKGLGYTTQRLSGADRFATALDIAKVGMDNPAHLVVARGDEGTNHDGFADALAAGPYAANVWGGGDSAVVLSNFNTFDPATSAYVQSKLKPGEKNVAAIGGQATAAMTTIKGSAGLYNYTVGATRYETAAQVAAAFEPTAKNAPLGVATGLLYPDALTGGAYMATIDGPLLLTDPAALSAATKTEISSVATTAPSITIFGGEKAVTPAVANAIAALVKVTSIGKF